MPSHPSNEERPRITITAERHDELVASEARLKELHGAGLRALELVGRTMLELARARQAGRRLADIHKAKRAELETGWEVASGALREALDITIEDRDELKVRVQEAAALLREGVDVVEKLEAERDAALEEVNDAKGREMGLTGVLNKLSDKYRLLKQSKEDGSEYDDPRGRIVDPSSSWEKCYEARKLAEHWHGNWAELHGKEAEKMSWSEVLVSASRQGKTYEWHLHEARYLAEHWRGQCGGLEKFPWEKDDGATASE